MDVNVDHTHESLGKRMIHTTLQQLSTKLLFRSGDGAFVHESMFQQSSGVRPPVSTRSVSEAEEINELMASQSDLLLHGTCPQTCQRIHCIVLPQFFSSLPPIFHPCEELDTLISEIAIVNSYDN